MAWTGAHYVFAVETFLKNGESVIGTLIVCAYFMSKNGKTIRLSYHYNLLSSFVPHKWQFKTREVLLQHHVLGLINETLTSIKDLRVMAIKGYPTLPRTGASPSDAIVSYPSHPIGGGFNPFVGYTVSIF